jgi:predicted DNA-binding transcriptional regulator AlpA
MHPNNTEGLQSISMFCEENDISESFFYKLRAQGRAPQVVKLGSRSFITPEAGQAWRDVLNEESQQQFTNDQLERAKGQNNSDVKTAFDSENFIIVVPNKSGRQNTTCLTPEQALCLADEIYEAKKEWQ